MPHYGGGAPEPKHPIPVPCPPKPEMRKRKNKRFLRGIGSQIKGGNHVTEYIYTVVREYSDGSQAKRTRKICRYCPNLKVGGLYFHLGKGFPGMYRVLSVEEKECLD